MKSVFKKNPPAEMRGNIHAIREQVRKGARFYSITVNLGNGEMFEYNAPAEEIRRMKDHCSVDAIADLIGRPMVLKKTQR